MTSEKSFPLQIKIGEVAENILERLGFNVRPEGQTNESNVRRAPLPSSLLQQDDLNAIVDEAGQNRIDLTVSNYISSVLSSFSFAPTTYFLILYHSLWKHCMTINLIVQQI